MGEGGEGAVVVYSNCTQGSDNHLDSNLDATRPTSHLVLPSDFNAL
jgi:hypothetical protein